MFDVPGYLSELGGFDDKPHPALSTEGMTLRLPAGDRGDLFKTMPEAVQEHSARVVVADEPRCTAEVEAAKTIAKEGVVLFATAHGTSLKELLRSVALVPLDGDVGRVAIGDEKQRAAVVAQGSEDELG